MEKIELSIKGMHCASCAQIIERALKEVAGVISASVNFAAEKAIVDIDPQRVSRDDLIKVVRDVGYDVWEKPVVNSVDEEVEEEGDWEEKERKKELKKLSKKLWVGILLSLPVAI